MKCLIGASGLGDWWIYTIESVQSEEKADHLAWSLACEQYESYVGSNYTGWKFVESKEKTVIVYD